MIPALWPKTWTHIGRALASSGMQEKERQLDEGVALQGGMNLQVHDYQSSNRIFSNTFIAATILELHDLDWIRLTGFCIVKSSNRIFSNTFIAATILELHDLDWIRLTGFCIVKFLCHRHNASTVGGVFDVTQRYCSSSAFLSSHVSHSHIMPFTKSEA
ncbi:unnamed protein product [Gongylonema pulchrum]|uniref:Secreted protein n=1 Tax=Gongylonema pulchrum TaxID=637853 RepID=A0A183E4F7_9BILA|nr:unnamed protein product [Gongylonema pulchrum]